MPLVITPPMQIEAFFLLHNYLEAMFASGRLFLGIYDVCDICLSHL